MAIEVEYRDPFALIVRSDGRVVDGALSASSSSGGVAEALTSVGGRVALSPDVVSRLSKLELPLTVTVGAQPVAVPTEDGSHPFRCMASIAALRDGAWCEHELPSEGAAPVDCDAQGALAFRSLLGRLRETQGSKCWSSLAPEALTRLPRMSETMRVLACRQLLALAGDAPSDEVADLLVDPCAPLLPRERGMAWLRAKRLRELPAAFAAAQSGSSIDLLDFWRTYAVTGDPRVEQARELALSRFGPRNLKAFLAARKAITALEPGRRIVLCSFVDGLATVAIGEWDGQSRAEPLRDRAMCHPGDPLVEARRSSRRPAPKRLKPWVRAALGARTVELTDVCPQADTWFLPQ